MIVTQTNPLTRIFMIPFALFGALFLFGGILGLLVESHMCVDLVFILIGCVFSFIAWIHIHCDYARIHPDRITLFHARGLCYKKHDVLSTDIAALEIVDDIIHARGGREIPAKSLYMCIKKSDTKYLLREASSEKAQRTVLKNINRILKLSNKKMNLTK